MSEDAATEIQSRRTEGERRGITIGILVVALLCLSLFFAWHFYGVPGAGAQPAAETTR